MTLSLKNPETERLARALAKRTGESLTLAVTIALKERLSRQQPSRKPEGRFERIRKIVERTAPRMRGGKTSKELMDALYDDETGLPK